MTKTQVLVLCLLAVDLSAALNPKGADWTQDELDIVGEKLRYSMITKHRAIKELKKLSPWVNDLPSASIPTPPKFLRLGFHDCIPYDDVEEGVQNGCDGCLNPTGMATDLIEKFGGKGEKKGPEITFTDNNGLTYTAELLEQIYTNPDYPKATPSLGGKSLKDLGKSRADLWAYAALVATWLGVLNNNNLCDDKETFGTKMDCGNLRSNEPDVTSCKIEYTTPFVFKTGRRDCTPDGSHPDGVPSRDYFTSRHEAHANAHANGPWTVNYYKDNFNMTAREGIALMGGAHSYGKFNAALSYFRYSWTRKQTNIINNQLFRHYGERDQYFLECPKDGPVSLYGDHLGNKAKTSWQVNAGKFSKSGGPWQWFHRYDRCPASGTCGAYNYGQIQDRAEPDTPEHCCQDLEAGMVCQESCQKRIQNDETALPAEVGFYRHFEFDLETGLPSGCPKFDNTPDFRSGNRNSVEADCELEEYAPEGQKLHEIVDEFADDQQSWMAVFVTAMEKMLDNGYGAGVLTPTDSSFMDKLEG